MRKFIFWLPRIFVIIYITLVLLFLLIIYSISLELLISLIICFLLLLFLSISWNWELFGGILWILAGTGLLTFFEQQYQLIAFLSITLPLTLTGILFLICWGTYRKKVLIKKR